jgi:hypothetical protein
MRQPMLCHLDVCNRVLMLCICMDRLGSLANGFLCPWHMKGPMCTVIMQR